MDFREPKALIDRVIELRHDHAPMRVISAQLAVLGMAYANGSQWKRFSHYPGDAGSRPGLNYGSSSTIEEWDEGWDPKESQFRVVDDRTGPLVRRVAATTNASRVEASVKARDHHRGTQWVSIASASELALNGIEELARYTAAYRMASALRWETGSALLILRQMRSPTGDDEDQWVRWEYAPISDLIWDIENISPDLRDHRELVIEQPMTLKKFEQIFGPPEQYGIQRENLPEMKSIAGHHIAAAGVTGSSLFDAYARRSRTKAIRVLTYLIASDTEPGVWRNCYHIADQSVLSGPHSSLRGVILNWDHPENPFGADGLPIAKLDAFRRQDSVMAKGLPHVMASNQDLLNIATSIHFDQIITHINGQLIADRRSINEDELFQSLASGSPILFDSQQGQIPPPQYRSPPPTDHTLMNMADRHGQIMQDQAHISPLNVGQTKSHVPDSTAERVLREAGVVVDNVVSNDVDELSSLMKVTLGTIRGTIESGRSMVRKLHDESGFSQSDLESLIELDPKHIPLLVRVRESSIIVRAVEERVMELNGALMAGQISNTQHLITMSEELNRPISRSLMREIEFCRDAVRSVMNGNEWTGLPSMDAEMFARIAQEAIYGLDMDNPDHVEQIGLLEEAIQVQFRIAQENQDLQRPHFALNGQGGEQLAQHDGSPRQPAQGTAGEGQGRIESF